MAQTSAPPQLGIPVSNVAVSVSIIDSTARIRVPMRAFVKERVPGHDWLECPAYVFLVEHPSGQKVLFDLGVRRDISGFPPVILNAMKGRIFMDVEDDIASILQKDGRVSPNEINAIIWSHWHMDHNGDPSTFPPTTELVVGPGFNSAMLPGYPANPESPILETDYQGRNLREVTFDEPNGLQLGRFRAIDYFNDGSFYLLDSPGHAVGHLCALARTTPSTFIFMGGDACHHCGSLRPSKYLPLPDPLEPSPFSQPPHLAGTVCPGEILEAIHPNGSRIKPYYERLSEAPGRDVAKAEESLESMREFDANEDVFVVIAHDSSLLSTIDFFPKPANKWKERGWKQATRWRFLEDFHQAASARNSL